MANIESIGNVTIRLAGNNDGERIKALVFGVLDEFGLPSDPAEKDADLNDIENNYLRPGGTFEVIEDKEGRLVGTYGLYPLGEATVELRKMYFVPHIRGFGLGRRVLDRAVLKARELGFKVIVLETISVLETAIHLYTRFGFVPVPSKHASARVDHTYLLRLD